MNLPWKPADIRRVRDLIMTPLALEVLDGLGEGQTPWEVAPIGTDPAVVETAVDQLRRVGLATVSDSGHGDRVVALTDRGRRFLVALERFDDDGPESIAEKSDI